MLRRYSRTKTAPISISKRGDRLNYFTIERTKNDHGFYIYTLTNAAEKRSILIPRFVFGRFRACVKSLSNPDAVTSSTETFERSVTFLNKEYFYFRSSHTDLNNVTVQDLEERTGSSGYITVSRRHLSTLAELLYNESLQHPNDVLDGIVSYHKLFQFSFVKGSKSITSDLALRKDVLQKVDVYRPSLTARQAQQNNDNLSVKSTGDAQRSAGRRTKAALSTSKYTPKLGERFHDKEIKVDYSEIFSDRKIIVDSTENDDKNEKDKGKSKTPLLQFATPLSAPEIKAWGDGRFSFELDSQQANEFRTRFIYDRSNEFYLGFEIIDALFPFNKTLKTLQFPLYYMKVDIRESGRGVRIDGRDDGRVYLNHLALAQLVDKFSDRIVGEDPLDNFFETLLAQFISVDQLSDRITLIRHLPVVDEIFDRTREILFGEQNESGKGGILGGLNFKGAECDLQSVVLYRAPSLLSPLEQSLEYDLDRVHHLAHHSVQRFYNSLLGRFLTPELESVAAPADNEMPAVQVPGRLPHSSRKLFAKLHHHDLVLLEGPPGTGKTFTIMNLLIDSICKKKRVLVVSDQRAAIEALMEKIQSYLYTGDKGGSGAREEVAVREKNELLSSAVKVIYDLPEFEQGLAQVLDTYSKVFKTVDPGSFQPRKGLHKRLAAIDGEIDRLTADITQAMSRNMSDATAYSQREPHKSGRTADVHQVMDFLHLLLGQAPANRLLLDAFINNRLQLAAGEMESCYAYFKVPARDFSGYLDNLKRDAALLEKLHHEKSDSLETFQAITANAPNHEIIHFLYSVLAEKDQSTERGIAKIVGMVQPGTRSSMRQYVVALRKILADQIELLEQHNHWPETIWPLLSDIHEAIRLADTPNFALTLYRRIGSIRDTRSGSLGVCIQKALEAIEDLMQQRDKIVYECFVGNLHEIARNVTETRRRSGTNAITRIMALADNLRQFSTINESGEVFEEFRQALYEAFPIWIARKQSIPLLLPCVEQSFDLVIIDEATQCRVDDALSLMFRAKKILVVGDDRQTVLKKDSSIDDYLFKDHELDEHLRSTQARGFKGGGSNIFALVKSIKQGSVMLDEHYRCPSDIIAWSNRYVYGNELKVMQWRLPEQVSPVVIDDSEKNRDPGKKPGSGKFKGIETTMLDRFLEFVAAQIKQIEKETGARINIETDVALCYFLLKNEPYVQHVVGKFTEKLRRGNNILHGAGAALQGKERDYIFYFWDITRYNLTAFTQGDDENKRRGELNVLMSRPRKKAFHYLHHGFAQLDHNRSNITRYLWQTLQAQQANTQQKNKGNGNGENNNALVSLWSQLLHFSVNHSGQRGLTNVRHLVENQVLEFREKIAVGDARKSVDLVIFSAKKSTPAVGVVDLAGFYPTGDAGMEVVDYYFQLKRAQPEIDPIFMFPYEMVDANGPSFRALIQKIENN